MKKFLLLLVLCVATCCCFAQKVDLNQSLLAYYPFSGNANDSIAGNNGTVTGATLGADRNGKANSAYSFTSGNKIAVPSNSTFNFNNIDSFTFSVWINPNSIDPIGSKILSFLSLASYDVSIPGGSGTFVGKPEFSNFDGVNTRFALHSDSIVKVNTWQHILVQGIRSKNLAWMYINGRFVSSSTAQHANMGSASLTIGNDQSGSSPMRGSIDEVRIYKRLLNYVERNLLADIIIPDTRQRGLMAYYPMNGDGTDSSANPAGAVPFGLTPTDNRYGGSNMAYRYPAATSKLTVARASKFDFAAHDSFTISVWARMQEMGSAPSYLYTINDKGARMDLIMMGRAAGADSGSVQFVNYDGVHSQPAITIKSDKVLRWNRWQNIVIAVDKVSNTTRMYHDGVLCSQVTGMPYTFDTASIVIGNNTTSDAGLLGLMDDLKITGRLLTPAEIAAQYDLNYAGLMRTEMEEQSVQVYPNPADGVLNIATGIVNLTRIRVTDVLGKVVVDEAFTYHIDAGKLQNGVYFVNVLSYDGLIATRKIIIRHNN